MNRFFILILAISAMLMCGCDKKEVVVPPVMPTDIISEEDAKAAIGGKYELKLNYDAVVSINDNSYKASYLAEPLGSGDPVFVTVTSPSEELPESSVKELYESGYEGRTKKKKVEGLGNAAYIAFPSINIYQNGYLIVITAGSGDTQEQIDLLISLGKTAVENLDVFLQQYEK
ncbi:MAG: hypothetical protein J6N52_14645 [Clostridia bacterium]|nr:hypothetical protein [Clostridia bacterium]